MTMSAPDFAHVYLTSTLKKMDVTVLNVIHQVVDGTFQGGTYLGTLANDGVGLAPFHDLSSLVPAELQSELDEIRAGIIAGEIPTNPRELPEGDYSNVFFMSLAPGLNMISLPLDPITPYTARTFAEYLSASVVIKYDETRGRFVGYTAHDPGDGFTIEGGKGYIVNVPTGGTVAFAGTAWTNEPPVEAAPPAIDASSGWAFVVSGVMTDHQGSGHTVTVRNLRTGELATDAINAGRFDAVFADQPQQCYRGGRQS
jgi:hypothetical protein